MADTKVSKVKVTVKPKAKGVQDGAHHTKIDGKNKHIAMNLGGHGEEVIKVKLKADGSVERIDLPAGWTEVQNVNSVQEAMQHMAVTSNSQFSGFMAFTQHSPVCGYYWIGGRLVYR